MDLLYAGSLDGFCIVSSDSDFTRLASRLKESGQSSTASARRRRPMPFARLATQFIYLENISQSTAPDAEPDADDTDDGDPDDGDAGVPDLRRLLATAIGNTAGDDGWAGLRRGRAVPRPRQRGVRPPHLRPPPPQ